MTTLAIGTPVRIPAHRLSGAIVAFWGAAPDRRFSIELPDGTVMTVAESAVEASASAPEPPPQPTPPAAAFDLVAFARDLVRRTAQSTSDECRALNGLARAYLVCQGRRP